MRAPANGIEIEYETFGDPTSDPPLLLVMGLGAQMVAWDADFCEGLVDRGFFVIRFDNRDVGLSTKIDVGDLDVDGRAHEGARRASTSTAPYLLTDMAADAVGLLDHLGIDRAHIVGASMGGMIVQTIAIDHPERVLSLTSIMSTTGDPDVGQPDPEVARRCCSSRAAPSARPTSPAAVDGGRADRQPRALRRGPAPRARRAASFDRCFYPAGVGRQLLAILVVAAAAPTALRRARRPDARHPRRRRSARRPSPAASARPRCIPGAELLVLEGMGHDLPPVLLAAGHRGQSPALAARADRLIPATPTPAGGRTMGPLAGRQDRRDRRHRPRPVLRHDARRHGRRRHPGRPGRAASGAATRPRRRPTC